ncbi:MAG: nitroreductase family deazaflavin-dependent oxidoreductase [Jiangellaceae bacterium]|nr:nitroreductase family deazaflavin-dependent oxidoreductase [Jiangellaceae bacterium]
MSNMKRRFTRVGNRIGVWMYRTLNGRPSRASRQVKVLVITTPGRRTGIPRATCVRFLQTPSGFVVWGTASGSPREPDWFRNLRAAQLADVQVGAKRLKVRPRELVGAERDATWNTVVLAEAPKLARYERRARRTIPVALLQPVDGGST